MGLGAVTDVGHTGRNRDPKCPHIPAEPQQRCAGGGRSDQEMPEAGALMTGLMIGCGAEGGPAAAGGGAGLAGGDDPLTKTLRGRRVASACHELRAPLCARPIVPGFFRCGG